MFEVHQDGDAIYVTNILKKEWIIEGEDLVLTIREARDLAEALATRNTDVSSIEMEKEWEDA